MTNTKALECSEYLDNALKSIQQRNLGDVRLWAEEAVELDEYITSLSTQLAQANTVIAEQKREAVRFGKYYGAFKMNHWTYEGKVKLDIESTWGGSSDYEGETLTECIAKALEDYYDRSATVIAERDAQLAAAESQIVHLLNAHNGLDIGQPARADAREYLATRQPTQDKE